MRKTRPPTAAELEFIASVLRKLNFFSGLSMGELERALSLTRIIEYGADETIFKKGEVGDALYVVSEGSLKVTSKGFLFWKGKTLATLGKGDIFGEMALLDQPYRTATVSTETPVKLFVLLVSSLNELFGHNQDFVKSIADIARMRTFELKRR